MSGLAITPDKWRSDNPGIVRTSHLAVGADADVDGTGPVNSSLQDLFGAQSYSSVFGIQEIFTGTAAGWNVGLLIKAVCNNSSNPISFVGVENTTATAAGSTVAPTVMGGIFNSLMHRGTGTISQAYATPGTLFNQSTGVLTTASGIYGSVNNNGGGTLTTASTLNAVGISNTNTGVVTTGYGVLVGSAVNSGGGTFTNNYGVYIQSQSAVGSTLSYNLYSAGGSAKNYFEGPTKVAGGGSTAFANMGGVIFDHYADVNNSGTGETDLYTDTIAASTLNTNGNKITAQYGGIFTGAAAATQQLRAYFGGTIIYDSGALSIGVATNYWTVVVTAIRVSSSVVRCNVAVSSDFATLFPYSKYVEVTGLTLTNTQILKITGQAAGAGGASNQITAKEGFVEYKPAA